MKKTIVVSMIGLAALIITSCKKDSTVPVDPTPVDLTPKITSISPTEGRIDTVLTITGKNLSISGATEVKIAGVSTTLVSANDSIVRVKIPSLLVSGGGTVDLTTSKGSVTGPSFKYLPDVYVIGTERNAQSIDAPLIWRNGTAIAINTTSTEVGLTSIVLSGSDVYVSGNELQTNGTQLPRIWRNQSLLSLSNSGNLGDYVQGIYVNGSTVYASGNANTPTNMRAIMWSNGTPSSLTSATNNSYCYNAVGSGSEVYIVGYDVSSQTVSPCYWKNGTRTNLSGQGSFGEANNGIIVGTDVYFSGYTIANGVNIPCYWKNGVRTDLPYDANTGGAIAVGITVNGTDVYVGGYKYLPSGNTVPVYWKNGTLYNGSNSTNFSRATEIAVCGTDVYLSGYESLGNYTAAMVWKNGVAIRQSAVGRHAFANDFAIR
ncbi:MAG: IPT/TIG domain-containing protein [Chitinophagaceae bacterium]|nr:IPT/TIG domain-containing protein [Chitinophagaceae bacterium]